MNYHRGGYTIRCYYLTDKILRITCKPNIYCKAENNNHKNVMLSRHEHIRKNYIFGAFFQCLTHLQYWWWNCISILYFLYKKYYLDILDNNNSTLLKFNCSLEVQLIKSIKRVDIICKTRTIYDTCFNFHTSLHFNSILTFRSNNRHLF